MQGSQVPVNVLFNNNKLNLKVCYITIRLFQGAVGPMWKRKVSCSNVVPSWWECETEDFAYKFNFLKFTRKYNNGYLLTKNSTL